MIRKISLVISLCLGILMLSAQEQRNLLDELQRAAYLSELNYTDSALNVIRQIEHDLSKDSASLQIVKIVKMNIELKHFRHDSLIATCNTLLKLNETYPMRSDKIGEICFNLGQAHKEIGQFKKAEEALRLASNYTGNRTDVIIVLSEVLIQSQKYNEALEYLDKIEAGTQEQAAEINVLKAKALFLKGNTSEAEALLLPLIESNPYSFDYDARELMGDILVANDRSDLACKHYQEARRHNVTRVGAEQAENKYYIENLMKEMVELELKIKNNCK